MRVYFKGAALAVALVLVVLLVQRHYRLHRAALQTEAKKARANAPTSANRGGAARAQTARASKRGAALSPASAGRSPKKKSEAGRPPHSPGVVNLKVDQASNNGGQQSPKTQKTQTMERPQNTLVRGTTDLQRPQTKQQPVKGDIADWQCGAGTLAEEAIARFQPTRDRPKPPEVTQDASKSWLKDMTYPSWYTESVKRSKVYGKDKEFVGHEPLYPGPCAGAEEAKEKMKQEGTETFGYLHPGKFLPPNQLKNPCWYEDPSNKKPLRCLPYFYVAGVAKCGTTDFYKRLRLHPDVMQGKLKEYHWWDRLRYGASMELKFTKSSKRNDEPLPFSTYSEIITGDEMDDLKADLRTTGYSKRICGDGSPSYLWDATQWSVYEGNEGCTEPRVITGSFLREAYKDAKFFILLRHPTPRLYSRFLSRIPRVPQFKGASPQMFHGLAVHAVASYKRCFKEHSIRECAYNMTLFDEAVIRIIEGLYSVFVEDWFRVFDRSQIMFIRNEDYSEAIGETVCEGFRFLNLTELQTQEWRPILTHFKTNTGTSYDTVGSMLPETVELLNEFYKPFVLRLAELLDDNKFLWKDQIIT